MTPPSNQPESTASPKPVLVVRDWLTVVILLLIMTLLWIGFGIYQALTAVNIPEPLGTLTAPVQTDIDTGILEELSRRQQLRHRDLPEADRVRLEAGSGSPPPASPSAQP